MSDLREQVARAIYPSLARGRGEPWSAHPAWTDYPSGRRDDLQREALVAADAVLEVVGTALDDLAPPEWCINEFETGWDEALRSVARACGLEAGR